MVGRVVPMRIGDVEVLVEAMPVAGTEPTSALSDAADKLENAWNRAASVIEATAVSTLALVGRIGQAAASPDSFEIEMSLGFTASGNVVIASASGAATLKVKLTYKHNSES